MRLLPVVPFFPPASLRSAGRTVAILEARERVGGRVASARLDGVRFELGAQWIHGCVRANPCHQLLPNKRLLRVTNWDRGQVLSTAAAAAGIDPGVALSQFDKLHSRLVGACNRLRGPDVPLVDTARTVCERETNPDIALQVLRMGISSDYAADLEEMSSRDFDEDEEFGPTRGPWDARDIDTPDSIICGEHGVTELVHALLPPEEVETMVHFGWEVNLIDATTATVVSSAGAGGAGAGAGAGAGVSVRAADGRIATATCGVIVAVPLGVLQQSHAMVFVPPFEHSRLNAMNRIGMADMCKLTLTFAQRWWPVDVEVVTLLDEPPVLAISLDDVLHADDSRGADAVHALQFFATGQEARAWEGMDPDAVVARVAARYPALGATDRPLSAHLTHWSSAEPYTRGAYSFAKVGGSRKCFAALAKPLEGTFGRVQFAGEHTSAKYNATMHGAILSGRDAAQRLLKLF